MNSTNVYFYDGPTIDISENDPQTLAILDEIKTVITNIKCVNAQGYGTLTDYEELFRLACSVSKIKLELDTGNIDLVAAKAQEISEILNSFTVTLPTVLNLISIEDLLKIKNALLVFLQMLETIENFTLTIQNQFVIRNSLVVNNLSVIINQTYRNLNCILFRDTRNHQIPDFLLVDPLIQLQPQINQFNAYSLQMMEFANSLGLGCSDSCSTDTSSIDNNFCVPCPTGPRNCPRSCPPRVSPNRCEIITTDDN